jgi:hypothetical protein
MVDQKYSISPLAACTTLSVRRSALSIPQRKCISILLGLALLLSPAVGIAGSFSGYAAMGDSLTSGSSWVNFLAGDTTHSDGSSLNLNFGGAGNPYNFAVSGATSAQLLSGHQNTNVASLVQARTVQMAFLEIGGDDLGAVLPSILNGTLSGNSLTSWAQGVQSNISTAMDTVLATHPAGLIVNGVADPIPSPLYQSQAASLAAQGYTQAQIQAMLIDPTVNAIQQMNALNEQATLSRGLVFLDLYNFSKDLLANPLVIGGVTMNMSAFSTTNQVDLFTDSTHPNTIFKGLIANAEITAMNIGYHTNLPLLTNQQLLAAAGLSGQYTGETFTFNYAPYVLMNTPEPSTLLLASLASLAFVAYRRCRHEFG